MYIARMDVAVSVLRAELARWLELVRDGEEVVVTDRGVPVARLLPIEAMSMIEQLTHQGVLSKPRRSQRPSARGTSRVQANGPVAEIVSRQRR